MQDCFRQHPEMYGSELEDDEEEIEEEIRAQEAAKSGEATAKSTAEPIPQPSEETPSQPAEQKKVVVEAPHRDSQSTTLEGAQKAGDEGGELVPKAAFDASSK